MLDRSEEVSEVVTWEDQSMINTFSKLVSRLAEAEEQLRSQSQEKEYLEDVETELELADGDDDDENGTVIYKIGDCFTHLPLKVALRRLHRQKRVVEAEVDRLEGGIDGIKSEMDGLKIKLKVKDYTDVQVV